MSHLNPVNAFDIAEARRRALLAEAERTRRAQRASLSRSPKRLAFVSALRASLGAALIMAGERLRDVSRPEPAASRG